jgi:hypothetical protein
MAINEADILRQLGAKGIGKATDEVYRDLITDLADSITETFREYTRKNTRGSGTLGQSFKAEPAKNGFTISADFYYDFIDEGVKGAPLPAGVKQVSRTFTGASRFSFKNLGVSSKMEKSIAEWTGRPIGQNYGVAINIKKRGIHPKNITDNVIDQEMLDKIGQDLTDLTGLAFQVTFDKAKDKLK